MEMKFILLFTIILIICFLMIPFRVNYTKHTKNQSDLILSEYEQYLKDFNKSYGESSHEFTERERIFKNSKDLIERMNSYRQSNESASYGLTPYSDLTQEEFLQHQLKKNPLYQSNDKLNELIGDHKPEMDLQINDKDLVAHLQKMSTEGHPIIPLRLNWSELGKASPVLSQGKCGACWAISVLGAIQSLIAIQTETDSVEELSVQELIDCAGNRNKGCKGGDICSLLDWLVDNKIPLATNKEYPAKEYGDPVQSCQMDKILKSQAVNHKMPIIVNSTCTNFVNRESLILYHLAHYGPVAAAVNALSWQNYLGGIVQYHCDGNPIYLNHAVQIIGYDISGTIPYYIVRNSWGKEFGHNGDLKIAFGKNMCGIANQITIIDVSFV